MSLLLNFVYFALVLSVIVFIHELGHYLAAKHYGVYVNEFAIGMGPTLIKFKPKNNETTFSIRALPLGGFVSMAGEPGEADFNVPMERTIQGIARYKRIVIMLAGIAMNFVLAFCIFWGMATVYGVNEPAPAIIYEVMPESPAEKAGLLKDDVITKMSFYDGTSKQVHTFNDVLIGVGTYEEKPLTLTIDRQGESLEIELVPELDEATQRYLIGFRPVASEMRQVNAFEAIGVAFGDIGMYISQLGFLLARLVRGIGLNAVSGPIGIFQETANIGVYGLPYFFLLTASMSVSLAVMNLLPIPILDGGRALITCIEMILNRDLSEALQQKIMIVGMTLMGLLFILIMSNDILKLLK